MSTEINLPDFPDTGLIEELANRIFKDLPVDVPVKEKVFIPSRFDPLLSNDKGHAPTQPIASNTPYPKEVPPSSFSGAGVSPGAAYQGSALDLRQREQQPYQYTIPQSLESRPSVAGSGVSPSVINQGNEVDLKNPRTSLPDPRGVTDLRQREQDPLHYTIPQSRESRPSVAGSGISPSAAYQGNEVDLRNPRTSLPDPHFVNANSATSYPGGSPLPSSASYKQADQLLYSRSDAPSYYFLQESNYVQSLKSAESAKVNGGNTQGIAKLGFDPYLVKNDFPILLKYVNGKPLIWLDNAATTQKPKQVIDRLVYFYENENSNVHRAAHTIAARATDAYEEARQKVKSFLNAASVNEIVFVRGTTEAINLVAKTYGEQFLKAGDEIIVSHLEHHANIVPWQQLAQKNGIKIKVIPVDGVGQIILDEYKKLLSSKTKIVAFTQVSNALGTVTPAKEIIDLAHGVGAKVLVDGAQSVSHIKVDLQHLKPDFFVFSGHKIFGPNGIGVLYGREELLNSMQPWQGGGNMIKDVTFEYTQFHNTPTRFEAGTGNIADAAGLSAALDYVNKLGIDNIYKYENYLLEYATRLMERVPGLKIVGTARDKASVLSFTLEGFENAAVGKALNEEGIAVRTGNHCAQPILRRFGLESTVRPSLAFYNTPEDVDKLVSVLHKLKGK